MKHPVQNTTTTNATNATAPEAAATPTPKSCPAGHCGKAGHQCRGRKLGQFTIKIVQNKPNEDVAAKQQKFGPYAKNIAILQQLGFKRPGVCLAFLKKTENDVGKAAEQLFIHKRNRMAAKKAVPATTTAETPTTAAESGEVDPESLYADQIAALQANGFKCKGMMIRLLTKFDGDVDKVTKIITKRQAARKANVQTPAKEEPSREALATELAESGEEPSVCDPEAFYAEQIAALQASGFKWKKLMIRLLAKHDGDAEKVGEILATRRAAREAKAAATSEEGTTEAAPVSALNKSDSVELSEEQLREKLMEKFKGNTATVDRVMARRKAQAAKRQTQIQNKKPKMQLNKKQRMKLKQERQQAKQAAKQERIAQKAAAKETKRAAKVTATASA
jgi:hypothetical protein